MSAAQPIPNWEEAKKRALELWPGLTEKDLDSTGGDRNMLVALLEDRLGYARRNAEGDVDALSAARSETR